MDNRDIAENYTLVSESLTAEIAHEAHPALKPVFNENILGPVTSASEKSERRSAPVMFGCAIGEHVFRAIALGAPRSHVVIAVVAETRLLDTTVRRIAEVYSVGIVVAETAVAETGA